MTNPLPPSSSHPYRPEVHGHRGCRGLLPENTLPAFLHALALGVDVLEMDVVISQDNQVVVSHEPWLSAQLGTGPAGESISPAHERAYNLYQMPYATIRRCVVGERPHPQFPEQQMQPSYRPLLREVLQATEAAWQQLGRSPICYSIEIKSSPEGDDIFQPQPAQFAALILAELQAAAVVQRTTIICFDPRVLQVVRQQAPQQAVGLLSETPASPLVLFEQLGFVPDTFGPDFCLLSADMIQLLATTYPHLRLVPWTINELADMQQALAWQVDGITTDFPDRLLALLSNYPNHLCNTRCKM